MEHVTFILLVILHTLKISDRGVVTTSMFQPDIQGSNLRELLTVAGRPAKIIPSSDVNASEL